MQSRTRFGSKSRTAYLDEQSDPKERRYVFSLHDHDTQRGLGIAQLLTRHWVITDANGKVQEVRGDGVVGEQPHLKTRTRFFDIPVAQCWKRQ